MAEVSGLVSRQCNFAILKIDVVSKKVVGAKYISSEIYWINMKGIRNIYEVFYPFYRLKIVYGTQPVPMFVGSTKKQVAFWSPHKNNNLRGRLSAAYSCNTFFFKFSPLNI